MVKACTSRFLTSSGNTNVLDLRITDSGKVTVCDYFFDDLQSLLVQRYARKLIGNDNGVKPPPPGVATVSLVRGTVQELIAVYAAAGLIDGQASNNGLVVQRNVNPSSSIGIIVPLFAADLLHQVLVHGLQV